MIEKIKKYRLTILMALVLIFLLFYFLPKEENHYIEPELNSIKTKSQSVVLWAEAVFFAILFVLGFRQLKKITEFLYLVIGLGSVALSFFFLLSPIFLSAAFFINRIYHKKLITKKYSVVYVDYNNKSLLIWDNSIKKSIQADRLLISTEKVNINLNDTITVGYTKGLFNFNFDPVIK